MGAQGSCEDSGSVAEFFNAMGAVKHFLTFVPCLLLGVSTSETFSEVKNCEAVVLEYCCNLGTLCNCNEGSPAEDQCTLAAYEYCCDVGNPCICGSSNVTVVNDIVVEDSPFVVEEVTLPTATEAVRQCDAVPYEYCCNLGTPCNCNEGSPAPDQCTLAAYEYCCDVGNPCMCGSSNVTVVNDIVVEEAPSVVEVVTLPTATEAVRQCDAVPYEYCCNLGTPCNCNEGSPAQDQCTLAAYEYCCDVGNPCMCGSSNVTGVENTNQEVGNVAGFPLDVVV